MLEHGLKTRFTQERLIVERGIAKRVRDWAETLADGRSLLVISDVNTHSVLGHRFGGLSSVIYDSPPKPTLAEAENLAARCGADTYLIAIGSGSINDICKMAAHTAGVPYAVAATAPSMNGYASANASLWVEGLKTTLPATAPESVFCDLGILAAAPVRLIQAGLGDLMCRSTVQLDWLLSHHLLGTRYTPHYFEWLAPVESVLTDRSAGLLSGDMQALEALTLGLLMSGLAMRDHGGSHPASQGEHLIAHTMEMLHPNLPPYFHGEEIAVTTMTMARRQEELLKGVPQVIDPAARLDSVKLPPSLSATAVDVVKQKFGNRAIQGRILQIWPIFAKAAREMVLPADELETVLSIADVPIDPRDLGWNDADYVKAVSIAPLTRDRFTFLDLEN